MADYIKHDKRIRAEILCILLCSITGLLCLTQLGHAQSSDLLKLPAHTDINKVSWRDSIYRFPDFKPGKITLATGFSPEGTVRLNYNLYFAQMDLINDKGDTVQVTPSKELKLVEIDGYIFYHDIRWGYIEVLSRASIALGVLTLLSTEKMEYVSGSFDGNSREADTRGQRSGYNRYYKKAHTYFLIDRSNKLHKANKTSILKLFGQKEIIRTYFDENEIDFNTRNDLLQALRFCNEL